MKFTPLDIFNSAIFYAANVTNSLRGMYSGDSSRTTPLLETKTVIISPREFDHLVRVKTDAYLRLKQLQSIDLFEKLANAINTAINQVLGTETDPNQKEELIEDANKLVKDLGDLLGFAELRMIKLYNDSEFAEQTKSEDKKNNQEAGYYNDVVEKLKLQYPHIDYTKNNSALVDQLLTQAKNLCVNFLNKNNKEIAESLKKQYDLLQSEIIELQPKVKRTGLFAARIYSSYEHLVKTKDNTVGQEHKKKEIKEKEQIQQTEYRKKCLEDAITLARSRMTIGFDVVTQTGVKKEKGTKGTEIQDEIQQEGLAIIQSLKELLAVTKSVDDMQQALFYKIKIGMSEFWNYYRLFIRTCNQLHKEYIDELKSKSSQDSEAHKKHQEQFLIGDQYQLLSSSGTIVDDSGNISQPLYFNDRVVRELPFSVDLFDYLNAMLRVKIAEAKIQKDNDNSEPKSKTKKGKQARVELTPKELKEIIDRYFSEELPIYIKRFLTNDKKLLEEDAPKIEQHVKGDFYSEYAKEQSSPGTPEFEQEQGGLFDYRLGAKEQKLTKELKRGRLGGEVRKSLSFTDSLGLENKEGAKDTQRSKSPTGKK